MCPASQSGIERLDCAKQPASPSLANKSRPLLPTHDGNCSSIWAGGPHRRLALRRPKRGAKLLFTKFPNPLGARCHAGIDLGADSKARDLKPLWSTTTTDPPTQKRVISHTSLTASPLICAACRRRPILWPRALARPIRKHAKHPCLGPSNPIEAHASTDQTTTHIALLQFQSTTRPTRGERIEAASSNGSRRAGPKFKPPYNPSWRFGRCTTHAPACRPPPRPTPPPAPR